MRIPSGALALVFLACACGGRAADEDVNDPSGFSAGRQEKVDVRSGDRPSTGQAPDGGSLECPVLGGASGFGPVVWPAGMADTRWMIAVTEVASVESTKERPVEVCGVGGELTWLVALTCPDGSHPFSSTEQAHNSRTGNVGAGGRCGTIIDLYAVPCPDKTYEVYMDMYQCMASESFF